MVGTDTELFDTTLTPNTSDRATLADAREIQRVMPEWNVAATSNPYAEYLEQAVVAQDAAGDRINGYLALSMADTLLAAARWLVRRKRP